MDPFVPAKYRTVSSCFENFEAFKSSGSKPQQAKKFMNCINKPLMMGSPEEKLVDIFAIPELHIMEGIVNTLIEHLEIRWTKENMNVLYSRLHITKTGQHGGKFNGNPCRLLLRNWAMIYDNLPIELKSFGECLRLINLIVDACFGTRLDESAESHMKNLEQCFKSLIDDFGVSMTPKFHILLEHVIPFCTQREEGLGMYSEQAGESVHHDFNVSAWSRFKIAECNPKFEENILKAVLSYNGKHMISKDNADLNSIKSKLDLII